MVVISERESPDGCGAMLIDRANGSLTAQSPYAGPAIILWRWPHFHAIRTGRGLIAPEPCRPYDEPTRRQPPRAAEPHQDDLAPDD